MVGDLDGDGIGDLAFCDGEGIVALHDPAGSRWRVGDWGPHFATGCVVVGDVDDDGVRDLAIAGTLRDGQVVEVVSGANGAFVYRLTRTVPATGSTWHGLRIGLCSTGDVDGDALDDFAAAYDFVSPGEIVVHSARDGSVLRRMSLDGFSSRCSMGACGDRDGDGLPELATLHAGRITVHRPATGERLDLEIPVAGTLLDAGGDLDGDGLFDFLVLSTAGGGDGRPFDSEAAIHCISGRSGVVLARIRTTLCLGTPSARLFGDTDADGRSEVAVAIPARDRVRLVVLSGRELLVAGDVEL